MIRYLVLSVLLGALSATAIAADLPRLFGVTTTKSTSALPVTAGAVRERFAAPDLALLPSLASKTHDLNCSNDPSQPIRCVPLTGCTL